MTLVIEFIYTLPSNPGKKEKKLASLESALDETLTIFSEI